MEIQIVEFLLLVFTLLQSQVFKAADSFLRKSEKSFAGPLHSFSIIIHSSLNLNLLFSFHSLVIRPEQKCHGDNTELATGFLYFSRKN